MACFAVGTGIGGGLVINGPPCGCGNRGCLEAYASGRAIASMGMKAVVHGRTTIIGELVNFDINKITPDVIAQAAAQRDEVAQLILSDAGFYLGWQPPMCVCRSGRAKL